MADPEGPSIAIFPASFDPLSNGHLDLIRRAQRLFDLVVVAVATNVDKRGGTFTLEERIEMLHGVLGHDPRLRIDSFEGLLVEYAKRIGACAVIRGLRAMSDFEYEFEMALMNKHLEPEIEILFMITSHENLYVSSSRLKELARFGASVKEIQALSYVLVFVFSCSAVYPSEAGWWCCGGLFAVTPTYVFYSSEQHPKITIFALTINGKLD